ncbi:MAG: B12-binding domain-containing radical SAM protein [Candidatus Kuenenia sp.]|nr:B12-binding domain-containing radical SAM protein [Candidatus Kuenenia hertensis]
MTKNKVLLTILPLTWPNMPPIGLGFLQAFLEEKGIGADIIDFNHYFYALSGQLLQKQWVVSCNTSFEETIFSLIRENHPDEFDNVIERMLAYDVIGFSCFKSNLSMSLCVAKVLKSKKTDVKLVFGGPEITRQFFKGDGVFREDIFQPADYLIVGEGEIPLLNYLSGKKCRGKVARFEQLQTLKDIPFPMYYGVDLKRYPKKHAIPLQFSRGCIRRCNFCSERLLYKGFRTRSRESILDEIAYHKEKNNTKYFIFYDSLINANIKELDLLCDGIIEKFGSIHWEAQIAVRNDMDQPLFYKMKQSGCYNLFVGLESASDNTLKNMNKGFSYDDALGFFNALHKERLFFGVSIIVGYPDETEEDFRNTLSFIIRNKKIIPQIAQVNPFTYYDGTNTDKMSDYKSNPVAMERMEIFVGEIKKNKIRHTNAFLGNLIEKNDRDK